MDSMSTNEIKVGSMVKINAGKLWLHVLFVGADHLRVSPFAPTKPHHYLGGREHFLSEVAAVR